MEHIEKKIETPITPEEIKTPELSNAIEVIRNSIEISPALEEGVAICVIKPDAFGSRDMIVKRLEDSGLYIVKRTIKKLPENFVIGEMYKKDKFPKPIQEATARHFLSGESEIILVKGDDVISKLLGVVGLKTDPSLCNTETIRYIYGDHIPEQLEGGLKYYRNAAHRAMNNEERIEDINKFKPLL